MVNACCICKQIAEPLVKRGLHTDHFTDDDFKSSSLKRRINPNAIPSRDLPKHVAEVIPVIDNTISYEADNVTTAVIDTEVVMTSVTDEVFVTDHRPISIEADNVTTEVIDTKVVMTSVTNEVFLTDHRPISNEADVIDELYDTRIGYYSSVG